MLVLGGGFGGVQAAIALERLLPQDDEILLVSEQNFLLRYRSYVQDCG